MLYAAYFFYLTSGQTKTTLAAGKSRHCLAKRLLIKIRPKGVGKDQLGISRLPENKITDAVIPTVRIIKSTSC